MSNEEIRKEILTNCFFYEFENPNKYQYVRFIIGDIWKSNNSLSTEEIDVEIRNLIKNGSLEYLFNESEMVKIKINKNLSLNDFYKAACDDTDFMFIYEEALRATIRTLVIPFNINDIVIENEYNMTGIIKSFKVEDVSMMALVDFDVEKIFINIKCLQKVK